MKKLYTVLYASILVVFIFLTFLSPYNSVTGAVTADFGNKTFESGDTLTGRLEIDIDEDNLPLGSLIEIRVGEQVVEKPLFLLLNDEQKLKVTDITYYPSVNADIRLSVKDEIQQGTSIQDYISGGATGFVTSGGDYPTSSVTGSSSGGGGGGERNYDFKDFTVSSEDRVVSFEDVRILGVEVIAARLLDGTPIDKIFVQAKVNEGDIEIKSSYSEKLKGFDSKAISAIRVSLSEFNLKASQDEMEILIKSPRGDLIKNARAYVPYGGDERTKVSLGEYEQEFLTEFASTLGKQCGESVCRIDDCVSPNVDAGAVMNGEIERNLVTRIVCSNSCLTEEKVAVCPIKNNFKVVRDTQAEDLEEGEKRLEVIDQISEEPVATLKVFDERLDLVFSQFS